MTDRRRACIVAFASLLLWVIQVASAGVDLTKGVINGRIAIMGVPANVPIEADCEVHLAKSGDETHESIYPCGTWFQPPIGPLSVLDRKHVRIRRRSV